MIRRAALAAAGFVAGAGAVYYGFWVYLAYRFTRQGDWS